MHQNRQPLKRRGLTLTPADTAAGLRLALTTLTVLPVRPGRIDRRSAAAAMSLAPAIGAGLGAIAAGVGWLLLRYGLAPLPTAAVLVCLMALLTRGLHLDGLADTVDGLASYSDRDTALAIMKAPDVGPMGVAALIGILVADTAALDVLLARHCWLDIALALACGRLAITLCCNRTVPAARADGLGALVAGTVHPLVPVLWGLVLLAVAWPATERGWTGLTAVGVALGASLGLLAHVRRRLGGITGDVLGACCELTTSIALVLFSVR